MVAIAPRRIEPAAPRIGTLFYLASVGLVGAATLVASLGIGFYLLVHPTMTVGAGRASGQGIGPGEDQVAGVALLPEPPPRSSTPASRSPDPRFPAGAPVASITSATSATALSAPPTVRLETVLPPTGHNEADVQTAQSGAADIALTRRPEGGQNLGPDANTAPTQGPQPNDGSAVTPDRPGEQSGEAANGMQVVRGIVTSGPNVGTWVVEGHAVRLVGIEPGPRKLLAALVEWVRAKGPVECVPREGTLRYRCFTSTGEDIAEAALLAGVGRIGPDATTVYENAELQARRMGKGLWGRQ